MPRKVYTAEEISAKPRQVELVQSQGKSAEVSVIAAQATGSSNRVRRAALLAVPLSIDAGEVTDKGSLNQRAVLANRAALIADLYAEPPPAHVIRIEERA